MNHHGSLGFEEEPDSVVGIPTATLSTAHRGNNGTEDSADFGEQIVEAAHCFEQGLEFGPYEARDYRDILSEIEDLGFDPGAVRALRSIRTQAPLNAQNLAVRPRVLSIARKILLDPDPSIDRLEEIAESDQVIALALVAFANSSLQACSSPIQTIRRALCHIGVEQAKKVITGAILRPLFSSSRLDHLWAHSLDIAVQCECLARKTGRSSPNEAYFAGLVHDIGRLGIQALPRTDAVLHHRLSHNAQCDILADLVLLGQDHGELGAELISQAGMTGDLVTAVRYHHRPELSEEPLASLIYLNEIDAGSGEDIPSLVRLKHGMRIVGVDRIEDLSSRDATGSDSLTQTG